jgi:lipid-A-disaccharide synthase
MRPRLVLLPGSRGSELKRHLPPLLEALELLRAELPALQATLVLPDEALTEAARRQTATAGNLDLQTGDLPTALSQADLALAKTGTVTMECAFFGVPTVTFYRASWLNYQIARRLITVQTLTMPNLLAGEAVYPELLQQELTAENLARTALGLLQDPARRQKIKSQLARIIATLGEPGAPERAAGAILKLFE